MVLEFTKLEYHKNFFNRTNPTQQCHCDKTNEKLKFQKKWYFVIYFLNNIFLLKIFKNLDIGPFWPTSLQTTVFTSAQKNWKKPACSPSDPGDLF